MAQITLKDWYTKTQLGSNANGLGASLIGIEDSGGYFSSTEVEGALQELAASIVAESLWDRDASGFLYPQNSGDYIQIGDGVDQDQTILTVDVTGTPTLSWDESEDDFSFTHGVRAYDGAGGAAFARLCVVGDVARLYGNTGVNIVAGNNRDIGMYSAGTGEIIIDPYTTGIINFGSLGTNLDITMKFFGTTNSGQFMWMEDEDRFDFADDINLDITETLQIDATNMLKRVSGATGSICVGNSGANLASGGNYNTFVGDDAGADYTTGDYAVCVGYRAGFHQLGNSNVCIGAYAGLGTVTTSTGHNNVCIGTNTGYSLTSGVYNMLIGASAGYDLTSGNYNTAIGGDALGDVSTGSFNVAIGNSAGRKISTNSYSTYVGYGAGTHNTASSNIFIGYAAGTGVAGTSTGGTNTGIGVNSLVALTTGTANLCVGLSSGLAITTGGSNTVLGANAGEKITTNSFNFYCGTQAGRYNSAGSNVGIGYRALVGVNGSSTGGNNTAIGNQAGEALTTGINNVFIGTQAGLRFAGGNSTTYIGYVCGRYNTATGNTAVGSAALNGVDGSSTGGNNCAFGQNALNGLTTGTGNSCLGYFTGFRITTASSCSYIGYEAGRYNTAASNTAIGSGALKGVDGSSTGNSNTAIGVNTLIALTTGALNTIIGTTSGLVITTGSYNTGIGNEVLNEAVGQDYMTAIGYKASQYLSGDSNVCIGRYAGRGQTGASTGTNNTFIGTNCGQDITTGTDSVGIGYSALDNITTGGSNLAIGSNAGFSITTNSNSVFMGTNAGRFNTAGSNFFLGASSGYGVDGSSTGGSNIGVGVNSLFALTTGSDNVCIGGSAGVALTEASRNILIGSSAGDSITSAGSNIYIGYISGEANVTNGANVGVGSESARYNTGGSNTFIGYQCGAGQSGASSGGSNTGLGYRALYTHTSGANNIAIGAEAGQDVTTGGYNILIGRDADVTAGGNTNAVAIGRGTTAASDTCVLGNATYPLDTTVSGNLTIGVGAAGVDYVVTINGETNDGTWTWMEDENYHLFSNSMMVTDELGVDVAPIATAKIYIVDNSFNAGNTQYASYWQVAHRNDGGVKYGWFLRNMLNATGTQASMYSARFENRLSNSADVTWCYGASSAPNASGAGATGELTNVVHFNAEAVKNVSSGAATLVNNYGFVFTKATIVPSGVEYYGWTTDCVMNFLSDVADSGTAVGFQFDTGNTLSTAGAMHSVWDNNGTTLMTLDPAGNLSLYGGYLLNIAAKTAAYTAAATDDVITCGAGNETFTVDLPTVVSGKVFYIKNVGTGTITVDADTTGSTTIDGSTTITLAQYETVKVVADASVYWII